MTDIQAFAIVGIALPFVLLVMPVFISDEMFARILGRDPLKPLLASFVVALGMYLPWIHQKFRQYSTMAVCGIAVAALAIHVLVAFVIFAIMFWIGGDTI